VLLERPFIDLSEAIVKDRVSGVSCLQEREIEALVRGKLSSDSEQFCLTHLMWCRVCQAKVEEEAEFAIATRDAAIQLQHEKAESAARIESRAGWFTNPIEYFSRLFKTPFPMRWAVAVASVGLLAILAGQQPWRRANEGQEVELRSERGSAAPTEIVSTRAKVRLRIDVSDVAPAPAFTLTVVDAAGRTVDTRTVTAAAGSLKVEFHDSLPEGRYWVRLSALDGKLLREYALRVRP